MGAVCRGSSQKPILQSLRERALPLLLRLRVKSFILNSATITSLSEIFCILLPLKGKKSHIPLLLGIGDMTIINRKQQQETC